MYHYRIVSFAVIYFKIIIIDFRICCFSFQVQKFKQFWHNYKSDPLGGRNFILSSICPQVFGLYVIKLAVALVLAGGVQVDM